MALLFFTKKDKTIADKIIGIWMIIIGFHLLAYHSSYLGLWTRYPILFGTTALFPLLHPPLLYLFTSYSLNGDTKFKTKDLFHFTPAVLSYFYIVPLLVFSDAMAKIEMDQTSSSDSIFISIASTVLVISAVVYTTVSLVKLQGHKKKKSVPQHPETVSLIWLDYWIKGITSVFAMVILITVLREGLGLNIGKSIDNVFYTALILLTIVLGYFGIARHGIFSAMNKTIFEPKKSKAPKLAQVEVQRISEAIRNKMTNDKLYLNPKLTLTELANAADTTANNLSEFFNQHQNTSFYDFVNDYRVEEFKSKASENQEYSILGLAYDSGFNSKSSFYTIFKRETGMTPSEFIKSQKY